MISPDAPKAPPEPPRYKNERDFRDHVRAGDWVRAGSDKRYMYTDEQYITKGRLYQVLLFAIHEHGYALRTTTDKPGQATYLGWGDLDMKEP